MDTVTMPPLGIMPEQNFMRLADTQRRQDIIEAMKRYSEAGKAVPIAWVEELERRINAL